MHRVVERLPWTMHGLIIRLVLSAALLLVSLLTNRSFLGWGVFAIFAIFIVPAGRIRSFLFSFGPYAAVWFVFTALRSLADETVFARTLNLYASDLERELFGGRLLTVILQDTFLDRADPSRIALAWYDYFFTAVHWSYFIVPHALAAYLWYQRPAMFRRFLGGMTLLLSVGLAIYFLLPSNPPWMAPDELNSPAPAEEFRVMETIGKQLGGGLYEASYAVVGESNPIAAMPSIHMAITFLLVFPAFMLKKRLGIVMLVYAASMGYALIYLGEHYFIDVAIGCAVAAYGWYGADHANRAVVRPLVRMTRWRDGLPQEAPARPAQPVQAGA